MCKSLYRPARRVTTFVAAYCLVVTQIAYPQSGQFSITQDQASQVTSELRLIRDNLEQIAGVLPANAYDADALSDELPFEAEDLVQWVGQNIQWVPYPGLLKNPGSVLLDKRANGLDMAILLGYLLQNAGYDARLARQKLTPEQAASVLQLTMDRKIDDSLIRILGGYNPDAIYAMGERNGVDRSTLKENVSKLEEQNFEFMAQLHQVVNDQSGFLESKVKREDKPEEGKERATENLVDYWWVQYKDKNQWIDADALVTTNKNGQNAFMHQADEYRQLDNLPKEQLHQVSLSIIAEQWKNGQTSEATALQYSFNPREWNAKPITLTWYPVNESLKSAGDNQGDQDSLRNMALNETEWMPVLQLDEETVHQSSIYTDGKVNKHPNLTITSQKFSSAIAALNATTQNTQADSVLSAIWIQYTIQAPGRPEQIIRRQIFDFLGEHARSGNTIDSLPTSESIILERGLALLGYSTILPTVAWLHPSYVQQLLIKNFLDNLEPALAVLASLNKEFIAPDDPIMKKLERLDVLPAELYAYNLLRNSGNPDNRHVFMDRPNIVVAHTFAQERSGSIVFARSIDIVTNDVSVVPGDSLDAWKMQLRQGVLDTISEVIAGSQGSVAFWTGFAGAGNAASLLYESKKLGINWMSISETQTLANSDIDHDLDTIARMRLALSEGLTVVAPRNAFEGGTERVSSWWEIDPATGRTLGRGPNGWGQDSVEFLVLAIKALMNYAWAKSVRTTIFCGFLAATVFLVLSTGFASFQINFPYIGAPAWLFAGTQFQATTLNAVRVVFGRCVGYMLFR